MCTCTMGGEGRITSYEAGMHTLSMKRKDKEPVRAFQKASVACDDVPPLQLSRRQERPEGSG